MAKKFWVNNYFIDVTRNQIQHQQQATPLPPKALKVLEVLASRAGEVVSHDELMDIVWENSVVGPNTLQRAIAQLRKAFGDDSKQQAFIKTHAKKGYSLEANVRWEEQELKTSEQVPEAIADETAPNAYRLLSPAKVAVTTILIVVLAFILWPVPDKLFEHMVPLTASDEQEFNASYSPDGNYLVFNRYVGQCESHLWAKNLTNNQEKRLITEPGHYSELSWSADGSQLAFVLQSDCDDKPEQKLQCWQMQTLDFAQAWNGNASGLTRYDCKRTKTTHPTWLNDGRIALLQYPEPDSNQPKLVIYDAIANTIEAVPYQAKGRIYSLAYARATGLLATVSATEDNHHFVTTLSPTGEIQSQAEIDSRELYSVYETFPVSFAPDGSHFLTSIKGKIYQLSFDGDLKLIHSRGHSGLWSPVYHPNKQKFAATFGTKDFDIGTLKLSDDTPQLEVMARSTLPEANAKFQENGELIAFFSRRSGTGQVWIKNQESSYQLTQFEQGIATARFSWSPDGSVLAVNLNHQIALVNLDGSHQVIKLETLPNKAPIAVDQLMPWTQQDKVLVTDNQAGKHQLFSIDLNSGKVTDLKLDNVLWAAYDNNNDIIFADQQNNLWRHTAERTQPLPILDNKLFGNYLLLKDDLLYGIDSQAQLWRYHLNTNQLETIATLDKDIIYVSDIRGEQLLATKFIGGRRELVEFSQ